jgi:hypothetical protein
MIKYNVDDSSEFVPYIYVYKICIVSVVKEYRLKAFESQITRKGDVMGTEIECYCFTVFSYNLGWMC